MISTISPTHSPSTLLQVVNCSGVQLQTTGIVPTVAVEKTDGCQLYVNKKVSVCGAIGVDGGHYRGVG